MLLLPLAESIKKGRGYFGKVVVHISKISYSMYLLNLAVIYEVFRDHFPPKNDWDAVLKYFLYWVILITASTALYRYFEKPVMNLRDKKVSFRKWKNVFRVG
jgi:peptidoglycan/LPS O-acetylase OafA/YrhL